MQPQQIPRLSVDSISFSHPGGHTVFRDFSFQAAPGEFVALLGPSGCGKSTLLNLLAGFHAPSRGTVRVDGVAVAPEMPQLGYVFQSPHLFPWLSALENVRFGLRMAGAADTRSQRERALHYLDLVGMAHAAARLPHELSGGMQQRVAIARALAMEPGVLLMDEPFSALDAITRAALNEELLRIWSTLGQTIVFITHDIDEAVFLADRVIVLGAAPAGVLAEVDIALPRPRGYHQARKLPRFAEYASGLMDQITLATTT
ncbi:ABC transporter ATP-binding protein [Oxalobacteraceae bacterium A2-2]